MKTGLVPVLHAATESREDELDTLLSARAVQASLVRLGYDSPVIQIGLDLSDFENLAASKPLLVFNLVEAMAGNDSLQHIAAAMLEHHQLCFTGGSCHALAVTRSKRIVKQLLRSAGIPTPDWSLCGENCDARKRYLVKADLLHGSLGMNIDSVVTGDKVAEAILNHERGHATHFIAEQYIEGREFNVAMFSNGLDAVSVTDQVGRIGTRLNVANTVAPVLPIQEIRFVDFAPDVPHIVDYAAKWDPECHRYHHTPRQFGIEEAEPALAEHLLQVARQAWQLLGLNGYGRVDLRADSAGNAYVIDINVNPAIAPDAGLVAAAEYSGLNYDDLIKHILQVARIDFSPSQLSN